MHFKNSKTEQRAIKWLLIGIAVLLIHLAFSPKLGRGQSLTQVEQKAVEADTEVYKAAEVRLKARAAELKAADALKKAEKERNKQDDKYLRKAREEAKKKTEAEYKADVRTRTAHSSLHLSGCSAEDADEVRVNPIVGNEKGLRHSVTYSQMTLTISNQGAPVSILAAGLPLSSKKTDRDLVTHLCKGGIMVVTFARTEFVTYDEIEILLTAISESTGQTTPYTVRIPRPSYYTSYNTSPREARVDKWTINLQ